MLTKAQRFADAGSLLLEPYPVLEAHFGAAHDRTKAARERIVALYEAWGKSALASRHRR